MRVGYSSRESIIVLWQLRNNLNTKMLMCSLFMSNIFFIYICVKKALLPSPSVLIIPSIYFSLCLPLALQPGILLSVKFCSSIFSLLFMGNYPIFCMFLLDVPCIMLECMCVLRRLGEFPLFSLFLWETILFFLFIHLLFLSFFYRSISFFSLLFKCVASSSD